MAVVSAGAGMQVNLAATMVPDTASCVLCCQDHDNKKITIGLAQVLDARAIGSNVGPCRGFGFVTMATVEAAAAAIKYAFSCILLPPAQTIFEQSSFNHPPM